ncbi:MAG: flagellar assembly protein FliH [Nitrococcus sp.]|nr:flagellar assembly protein FliH [Nitrococcus sp.]
MTTSIIAGETATGGQANAWSLPDVSDPTATAPRQARSNAAGVSIEALEQIQREAYAEAFAQGRREGHAAGFSEGRSEGLGQGQAEASELVRRMRALLDCLAQPATELDDSVEHELVDLTLCVARQIIRRELQIQPGEVVGIIREAIALLPLSAREIRVQVHPDDAAFIREVLGEGEMTWQLEDDPGITRGGCVINTACSRVDATLEHRLAALVAEMLGDSRRHELDAGSHEPER